MQAVPTAISQNLAQKSYSTGEVGLLGEEIPQRLLSIFIESASACLRQIYNMSMQHGSSKAFALYKVGLNVVAHWDNDVVLEETVRIETMYPEVMALHSYSYLWLLDTLFSDKEISNLAVPSLPDFYLIFIRRIVQHGEVSSNIEFLKTPIALQRCVYIDAFRNAYHDLIQKSARQARCQILLPQKKEQSVETEITAEDAPSEVAARLSSISKNTKSKADKIHSANEKFKAQSKTAPALTVVNLAKQAEMQQNKDKDDNKEDEKKNNDEGDKVDQETQANTAKTRALTIKGPCFFTSSQQKEEKKEEISP